MKITEITQQTNEGPFGGEFMQGAKDFVKRASLLPQANFGSKIAQGQLQALEVSKYLHQRFTHLMAVSGDQKKITAEDVAQFLLSVGVDQATILKAMPKGQQAPAAPDAPEPTQVDMFPDGVDQTESVNEEEGVFLNTRQVRQIIDIAVKGASRTVGLEKLVSPAGSAIGGTNPGATAKALASNSPQKISQIASVIQNMNPADKAALTKELASGNKKPGKT